MFTRKTATRIAERKSSQRHRRRRSRIGPRSLLGRDAGERLPPRTGDLKATKPLAEHEVDGDGDKDERPEHCIPPELADLRDPEQALVEEVDQHGTQEGTEERAGAAEDVDSAYDRRRHGLELEPGSGDDGDRPETAQEHETGEAGKRAGGDERSEDDAVD